MARTIVYVDGFNLYYGSLKPTPYKWLDVGRLCALMLPQDDIVAINYYTALVSARPGNPSAPSDQQVYLRALRTIPNLSITYGHFLTHSVPMALTAWRPSNESGSTRPKRKARTSTSRAIWFEMLVSSGSTWPCSLRMIRIWRNRFELCGGSSRCR